MHDRLQEVLMDHPNRSGKRRSLAEGIAEGVERRLSSCMDRQESRTALIGHGHDFQKTTFHKLTYCHFCTDLLWGLSGQGFVCQVCQFTCHEKCMQQTVVKCPYVQQLEIQVPIQHQWSRPISFQKKSYCNTCRHRIHNKGLICAICKYHSHISCKEFSLDNCKECATGNRKFEEHLCHHWIEGNLPHDAKCNVCGKNCSTTECLASMKCGWCGKTIHSACLNSPMFSPSCNYGDLEFQIIPPKAVTYYPVEDNKDGDADEEEDDTPDPPEEDGSPVDTEKKLDTTNEKRPIFICEGGFGRGSIKKRRETVKPILIDKNTIVEELLMLYLKKNRIVEPAGNFYVTYTPENSKEVVLSFTDRPYNYSSHDKPIKLYVHSKAESIANSIKIQVDEIMKSPQKPVKLTLDPSSTVEDIIGRTLAHLEFEDVHPSDYMLEESSPTYNYVPVELDPNEHIWIHLQDQRKVSLRHFVNIRYILKHRVKEVWTPVHISGLPKEKLETPELRKALFQELIDEVFVERGGLSFDQIRIGPGYPNGKCLFVECPDPKLAHLLCAALPSSKFKLTAQVLQSIKVESMGPLCEPVAVFINSRSGGNQGRDLLLAFKRHLNPYQVFDLAHGGPYPGLYVFRKLKTFRILIGGGDGTFGWVLTAIQDCQEDLVCSNPPSALLPLGTGNDLARALKWGSGYTGEKPVTTLKGIEQTDQVDFDRWNISFHETQLKKKASVVEELVQNLATAVLQPNSSSSNTKELAMNNYFGIGIDGQISYEFHTAREENPEKFNTRFKNKAHYFQLSLQKFISGGRSALDLQRHLKVTVDGKALSLPSLQGIVFLNIPSWAAGADIWGTTHDEQFAPASYNDGKLEVVGISGVIHMGQIHSGIRNGIRLAQGTNIKIQMETAIAVQVDGEAWIQDPATITILPTPYKAAMLVRSKKHPHLTKALSDKQLKKISTAPELLKSPSISSPRSGRSKDGPLETFKEMKEEVEK